MYNQYSVNQVLTLRVYVFRYQNRVNLEVNSISDKIRKLDEFDWVKTRQTRVNLTEFYEFT